MRFGRTVLIGTALWCAVISVLNYQLNREERREGRNFRVGFLPVT
jgi:hypothetical protein